MFPPRPLACGDSRSPQAQRDLPPLIIKRGSIERERLPNHNRYGPKAIYVNRLDILLHLDQRARVPARFAVLGAA